MWNEDTALHETRGTEITGDESLPPVDPQAVHAGDSTFEVRYVPKGVLGRGGMGEVFLCKDTFIGRDVALKLMREKNRDKIDAHGRFLREASIQGQLEHPAIVPIYDMGTAPTMGIFFTMKRVRGSTLREILHKLHGDDPEAKQKYSRAKLLAAFQQLCLAIDFAHKRGVVHRDLKPANVMLGDFGEVYVLDWGIAKIVEEQADSDDALASPPSPPTLEGAVIGTPGYMAPEQSYGEKMGVTAQSDVYALGIVLRDILGGNIPPELGAVVEKATKFIPTERYSSAREMAEAIERFLDGDRDLELRRALAAKQIGVAKSALARAFAASLETEENDRAEAMREISRALALDPENVDAQQLLVELLLRPPKKMPKAAEEERDRVEASARAQTAKYILFGIFAMLIYIPMLWWSGIRDVNLAIACVVVWAAMAAIAIAGAMMTGKDGPPALGRNLTLAASIVLFLLMGRIAGPLIMIPAMISAPLPSLMINLPGPAAWRSFVVSQLAIVLPVILEFAGVLPKSYVFLDGAMIIKPQIAYLTEGPIILGLIILSVATMAVPALLLRRVRKVLYEADTQRLLQAWYIKTLVGKTQNNTAVIGGTAAP